MTELLEFVFPESATKWRVGWFNEIKVPMLTAAILFDSGKDSLTKRMDMLRDIVVNNIVPALPGEAIAKTPEEQFVQLALKNK
jgi:hypothetical protein